MDARKIQLRLDVRDVELIADTLERRAAVDTTNPRRQHIASLAHYLAWRAAKFGDPADSDPRRRHLAPASAAAAGETGHDPR